MRANTTGLTDWQRNILQAVGGEVNAKMDLSAMLDSTNSNYLKHIEENTRAALMGKSADLLQNRYADLTKQFEAEKPVVLQNAKEERSGKIADLQATANALRHEANWHRYHRGDLATAQLHWNLAERQDQLVADLIASSVDSFMTPTAKMHQLYTQLEDLAIQLWGLGVNVQLPTKPTYFAKGGVFTNSVVDSPTPFNMGLMGEAGPEAIMPLHRAPDGSLGVRADVSSVDIESQVSLIVALNGIRKEIKSSSSKMEQRLQRLEEHAAASVRVQQHGFKGQIGAQQEANKELKKQTSSTRLESTK